MTYRPTVVDEKSRIGHWKGNTVSRKNAFVTMVERKTLFTLVKSIESKYANITANTLIQSIKHLHTYVLMITLDNGKEFAQNERIFEASGVDVYFAHPYSS